MGLTAADAVLAVVPMFHANAWGLPFAAPAVGARLVLPGRHADGERLARLIRDEGVTVAVGVPTVWLGLLEHLEVTGSAVPSLRSEEHTSELQSLMRISYAVFCLKKKTTSRTRTRH